MTLLEVFIVFCRFYCLSTLSSISFFSYFFFNISSLFYPYQRLKLMKYVQSVIPKILLSFIHLFSIVFQERIFLFLAYLMNISCNNLKRILRVKLTTSIFPWISPKRVFTSAFDTAGSGLSWKNA